MAISTLAAGLTIKVKDEATPTTKKIGSSFKTFKSVVNEARTALNGLAPAMHGVARAGRAFGRGMGALSTKAVDFEAQMAIVRSISNDSDEDFAALTQTVKRLGTTTVFTATQAGQAAQALTQAGFSAKQSIAALPAVLDAAAAGGLTLEASATLVSGSLKAFGMDASEAGRVADNLARTASATNTNMTDLGEGLKFVAPFARSAGLNIETTNAALGILANANLKGTVGGTALKNMLIQLSNPTKKATKAMQKYGNVLALDAETHQVDLIQTMKQMSTVLKGIEKPTERVAFMQDILGIRGGTAATTLANAFNDLGGVVEGEGTTKFEKLIEQMDFAGKSAKQMAEQRLNSLKGAFVLLQSAVEGVSIELFTGSLGPLSTVVKKVANGLALVAVFLQDSENILKGKTNPELQKLRESLGSISIGFEAVGRGIKEGLDFFEKLKSKLSPLENFLGVLFAKEAPWIQTITKFAVILAPVGILITGLAGSLAILIPMASGLASTFVGIVAAGKLIVGLVAGFGLFTAAVHQSAQAQDQSIGIVGSLMAAFHTAKNFILNFAEEFMKMYPIFIKPTITEIKGAVKSLFGVLKPIFVSIGEIFTFTGSRGHGLARTLAKVFRFIGSIISFVVKELVAPALSFMVKLFNPIIKGVSRVVMAFQDMLDGGLSLKQGLVRIFKGLGSAIFGPFLNVFSTVLEGFAEGLTLLGKYHEADKLSKLAKALNAKNLFAIEAVSGRPEDIAATKESQRKAGSAASTVIATLGGEQEITVKAGDSHIETKNEIYLNGKHIGGAGRKQRVELMERIGDVKNPFFDRAIMTGGFPAARGN